MNYRLLPLLIAAVTLLSAEELKADDKRGFAVNFGIGISEISDEDGDDTFNGSAFAYSFGVEYRFNQNFALGAGIFSLGTADDDFGGTNTEIEVRGGDIAMRLIVPVGDSVEIFGLLGGVWYTADLEPGGSNGLLGDSAVEFGLGLDIGSGPLSFRLAGRYFDGSKDESGALISVGFNYRF